jgi:hypothetical protein
MRTGLRHFLIILYYSVGSSSYFRIYMNRLICLPVWTVYIHNKNDIWVYTDDLSCTDLGVLNWMNSLNI